MRFFAISVLSLLLSGGSVFSQSLTSAVGGDASSAVPEDRQEQPGFTDLLESAGRVVSREVRGFFGETTESTEWDSNNSPRATLFTFVEGMDAVLYRGSDDLERVEKTLPKDYRPLSPEALALKDVLDRLGNLYKSDFPDEANLEDSDLSSFEVFPYALDHKWVWSAVDEPPRGRIEMQREGPEWRFTEETLAGAPELLNSLRAIPPVYPDTGETELIERVFAPMIENSPWWSWLVMVLSIPPAFLLGGVTRKAVLRFGDEIEKKTKPVIGSMVRSVASASAILVGVVIFVVGGSFIDFSPALAGLYWGFVRVVFLIALVFFLLGITDIVSTLVRKKIGTRNPEYGEMTVTIIQRVVRSFIFVILALFVLENVLGLHIGALITGLGIIGLALSLAGKETAQNLFGAISIFINRPFAVGDWVRYKGDIGEVVDVRMQATRIQILAGEMKIVPNMQFISNEVDNLSLRPFIRRELNITLPYGTPADKVDRAMEVLRDLFESEEVSQKGLFSDENSSEKKPASVVSFSEFGDYYLNLKIYYWYFMGKSGEELDRRSDRGWFSYLDHCTVVNQAILRAFDENDIEFAFPTQTIEMEAKKSVGVKDQPLNEDG